MSKRSLFGKMFGDRNAEKAFEKRLARMERTQKTILRLLLRREFSGSEILDPQFATMGLSVHSMDGEDGQLLHIFSQIGVTDRRFVEIGIQNGLECNTANLSFNFGWGGVLIEASPEDAAAAARHYACFPNVKVRQAFVTRENVGSLLKEAGAPAEPDLFSLDIDSNDYWIWDALADFRPRVAVFEYNAYFGPERAVTIPYTPGFRYGKGFPKIYHGASLAALTRLSEKKGYALVGCSDTGPNAFFVRTDALKGTLRPAAPAEAYRPVHLKRATPSAEDVAAFEKLPLVSI